MKLVDDPQGTNQFVKYLSETPVLNYAWLLLLAIWGGTSNYISRIKKQKIPFSIAELLGEWVISGFSGVITFYACIALGWGDAFTAIATGVAGHMGGRAMGMFESWLASRIPGAKLPPAEGDQ